MSSGLYLTVASYSEPNPNKEFMFYKVSFCLPLIAFVGCGETTTPEMSLSDSKTPSRNVPVNWILVKNGDPDSIKRAVISHTEIAKPTALRTFKVSITPIELGGFAVSFDKRPPPYAFANLIGWLNSPPGIENVSDTVGWYRSRSTDIRYSILPDNNNPAGDTLKGASSTGGSISVYLPELSVCEVSSPTKYVDDAQIFPVNNEPVLTFEVQFDVDESFGNPDFVITHKKDHRW